MDGTYGHLFSECVAALLPRLSANTSPRPSGSGTSDAAVGTSYSPSDQCSYLSQTQQHHSRRPWRITLPVQLQSSDPSTNDDAKPPAGSHMNTTASDAPPSEQSKVEADTMNKYITENEVAALRTVIKRVITLINENSNSSTAVEEHGRGKPDSDEDMLRHDHDGDGGVDFSLVETMLVTVVENYIDSMSFRRVENHTVFKGDVDGGGGSGGNLIISKQQAARQLLEEVKSLIANLELSNTTTPQSPIITSNKDAPTGTVAIPAHSGDPSSADTSAYRHVGDLVNEVPLSSWILIFDFIGSSQWAECALVCPYWCAAINLNIWHAMLMVRTLTFILTGTLVECQDDITCQDERYRYLGRDTIPTQTQCASSLPVDTSQSQLNEKRNLPSANEEKRNV